MVKESALDINTLDGNELLNWLDWMDTIADKIIKIIESGKGGMSFHWNEVPKYQISLKITSFGKMICNFASKT